MLPAWVGIFLGGYILKEMIFTKKQIDGIIKLPTAFELLKDNIKAGNKIFIKDDSDIIYAFLELDSQEQIAIDFITV